MLEVVWAGPVDHFLDGGRGEPALCLAILGGLHSSTHGTPPTFLPVRKTYANNRKQLPLPWLPSAAVAVTPAHGPPAPLTLGKASAGGSH